MNIMENKRVAAISLVMALAFGGICYYGYGRYSALKKTQAQIAEKVSTLESYTEESNPPNAKNRELATQAAKEAKELHDKLRDDLLRYASFCLAGQGAQTGAALGAATGPKTPVPYMPEGDPNKFQHNFKALKAELLRCAQEHNCKLAENNNAGYGNYNRYEREAAKAEDVPYLNFMLFAVNNLLLNVIESGAPAIKKVYIRELPPAAERKDKMLRLSFEIAFTAKRSQVIDPANPNSLSVLPQVLNKITHDSRYFYIPTGVAVFTPGSLPEMSSTVFEEVRPAADEMVDELDTAENAQETAGIMAVPRLGTGDEKVDVFLTMQVLYFNSSDQF